MLISKTDKDIIRKKNYRSISFMNMGENVKTNTNNNKKKSSNILKGQCIKTKLDSAPQGCKIDLTLENQSM